MLRTVLTTLSLCAACVPLLAAGPTDTRQRRRRSRARRRDRDHGVRAQDDFFRSPERQVAQDGRDPGRQVELGLVQRSCDEDTQPSCAPSSKAAAADTSASRHRRAEDRRLLRQLHGRGRARALGVEPLAGELAKIAALQDKSELPALFAHLSKHRRDRAVSASASTRTPRIRPSTWPTWPGRPGHAGPRLLPEDRRRQAGRHPRQVPGRTSRRCWRWPATGTPRPTRKAIVALETELAQAQWTKVENRDPVKTYNKVDAGQAGRAGAGLRLEAPG